MKTLEENVRMYVAALATSGNNFAVEGEYSPISEELKDEYVKSLMALISEAVNKARLEENHYALADFHPHYLILKGKLEHLTEVGQMHLNALTDRYKYHERRIRELETPNQVELTKTNTHMEGDDV